MPRTLFFSSVRFTSSSVGEPGLTTAGPSESADAVPFSLAPLENMSCVALIVRLTALRSLSTLNARSWLADLNVGFLVLVSHTSVRASRPSAVSVR